MVYPDFSTLWLDVCQTQKMLTWRYVFKPISVYFLYGFIYATVVFFCVINCNRDLYFGLFLILAILVGFVARSHSHRSSCAGGAVFRRSDWSHEGRVTPETLANYR